MKFHYRSSISFCELCTEFCSVERTRSEFFTFQFRHESRTFHFYMAKVIAKLIKNSGDLRRNINYSYWPVMYFELSHELLWAVFFAIMNKPIFSFSFEIRPINLRFLLRRWSLVRDVPRRWSIEPGSLLGIENTCKGEHGLIFFV